MRRTTAAALGLLALASTACFQIEQALTLERDLSGTARFHMRVDLAPVIPLMARMQRELAGKTGEPGAADLAAVRDELRASGKQRPTDLAAGRREIADKLPPGITLVDASFTDEDLTMAVALTFRFDRASKLATITMPSSAAGPENPIDAPFAGLQVVDEGDTILVTGPPQNPMASQKDDLPDGADAARMLEEAFKDLRVAFRISSPMAVVQHNAHRRDGDTLVWEYDKAVLEKLAATQPATIKVRFRK